MASQLALPRLLYAIGSSWSLPHDFISVTTKYAVKTVMETLAGFVSV
ncbi:MAG: hypothetical protein ACC631_01555 [Halocynthiibacter sp.]